MACGLFMPQMVTGFGYGGIVIAVHLPMWRLWGGQLLNLNSQSKMLLKGASAGVARRFAHGFYEAVVRWNPAIYPMWAFEDSLTVCTLQDISS